MSSLPISPRPKLPLVPTLALNPLLPCLQMCLFNIAFAWILETMEREQFWTLTQVHSSRASPPLFSTYPRGP